MLVAVAAVAGLPMEHMDGVALLQANILGSVEVVYTSPLENKTKVLYFEAPRITVGRHQLLESCVRLDLELGAVPSNIKNLEDDEVVLPLLGVIIGSGAPILLPFCRPTTSRVIYIPGLQISP